MAKKLISFLGTSEYLPCNYIFADKRVTDEKFIQKAICDLFIKDDPDAGIVIFLTADARSRNWEGENGLQNILSCFPSVKGVDLHDSAGQPIEGKNEDEIWGIFNAVFSGIAPGDEILLDITHGFRSLPMLGMVLLNYAKFLKNIKVSGIYYGAMEAVKDIRNKPLEDRNVPIFDLTPFMALNDWTAAADQFILSGNPGRMCQLLDQHIHPILALTQGKDEFAKTARTFSKNILTFSRLIDTNRGTSLIEAREVELLKNAIPELSKSGFKALTPILEKVVSKIDGFHSNSVSNGFSAVEWCIEHNLVQQGITIFQESITTWMLHFRGFGYSDKNRREDVASAANISSRDIPESQWHVHDAEFVRWYVEAAWFREIAKLYTTLSDYRNDINHAGLLKGSRSPETFSENLKKLYEEWKPHQSRLSAVITDNGGLKQEKNR